MWSFITIGRLFRAIRDAITNRDFASLIAAAKDLAELVGLSAEAKELVELIASASAGDWAGTLRNAGEFLIVVSERFTSGISIMASGDPLEDAIVALETQTDDVLVRVKDQSNDAKFNPLPVIIGIIQLIRFIRELRGKS